MRELIPKDDHVYNKDRQNAVAIFKISDHHVTSHLK